jgi:hypothetical protein
MRDTRGTNRCHSAQRPGRCGSQSSHWVLVRAWSTACCEACLESVQAAASGITPGSILAELDELQASQPASMWQQAMATTSLLVLSSSSVSPTCNSSTVRSSLAMSMPLSTRAEVKRASRSHGGFVGWGREALQHVGGCDRLSHGRRLVQDRRQRAGQVAQLLVQMQVAGSSAGT